MSQRRTRKNPLPAAPPKRRMPGQVSPAKLDTSLARVRKLASQIDERDRPFSPERPGSWRGSSRDLVVNRRGMRRNSHLVVLTEEDYEALPAAQRAAWGGYTYKMTYETWDEEALEIGETDDKGWVEEGSEPYESLKEVLRAAHDHNWTEWSSSNPDGRSWLISEDEEDHRTGEHTQHSLWIQRVDGQPLDQKEIDFINEAYGISTFGRMRRNPEGTWAHTANDRVWIPEVQFDQQTLPAGATIEPLRGYGHTMAVMDGGNCVGWIVVTESVAREINGGRVPYKRNASSLDLQIPTFGWRQIGGDMDPGAHGGIIATADGNQIELIHIQPVRTYVGDGEAAEVGFPFWTREATYDLDDLNLDSRDVRGALQYVGLDRDALGEMSPDQRVVAIAEALLSYGTSVEEGGGGWSKDIVQFPVEWWGGTTATFEEYCGDEDDEFRKDVLDEEWHYIYGSGSRGALYDNGPFVTDWLATALDDLYGTFKDELAEGEREQFYADLKKVDRDGHGIHYFQDPRAAGADYCEIKREDGPMPEEEE